MAGSRYMSLRLTLSLGIALAIAGSADAAGPPDLIPLGRNAQGEACVAQFDRADVMTATDRDNGYAVSCRGVAATRIVGSVRILWSPASLAAQEKSLHCGQATAFRFGDAGTGDARYCYSEELKAPVIALRLPRGSHSIVAVGPRAVAGSLSYGVERAAGVEPDEERDDKVIPVPAQMLSLALPADVPMDEGTGENFDGELALRQGTRLNQLGLFTEASRVLNDAISRLPSDTPPDVAAGLELEAGLADSNISFFDSAKAHFDKAVPIIERTANRYSQRKYATYLALDSLNQRQYPAALERLSRLDIGFQGSSFPLDDPATLAGLNSNDRSTNAVSGIAGSNEEVLRQRMVDAQAGWAKSQALLQLGKTDEAAAALAEAQRNFAIVRASGRDLSQTLWLSARMQRTAGRIASRKGDLDGAIVDFNAALSALRQAQAREQSGRNSLSLAVVETRFEVIGADLAKDKDSNKAIAAFSSAIEEYFDSGVSGAVPASGLERYLGLLVGGAEGTADPDRAAKYFRAVQAAGEASLARQISQLKSALSVDPKVSALITERTDIEQQLVSIRYQIGQPDGLSKDQVDALSKRRDALQGRLQGIDDSLAQTSFRNPEQRPVVLADLQGGLKDGEVYFKISSFNRRTFAAVFDKTGGFVYRLPLSSRDLSVGVEAIRKSAFNKELIEDGRLPKFDAAGAALLFDTIAGPARDRLLAAKRIIVDATEPFDTFPLSILVVDGDSAATYDPKGARYSRIDFLAGRVELATAISPRSFLETRALPPAPGRKKFLGLGEHKRPSEADYAQFRPFTSRVGCPVGVPELRYSYGPANPIDKAELGIAAGVLGQDGSLEIVDGDFSDTALIARKDLADYNVVHFATHGLTEGNWLDCAKAPPALVTSLGGEGSDGVLSFDEIARLDFNPNLVFLSACDTSRAVGNEDIARKSGGETKGSSLSGLVTGFFTARARAVVATYWESSDSPGTLDLVRSFYETGARETIGASLKAAQAKLRSDPSYSHPFYWAPYFIVGDPDKMMISPVTTAAR